MGAGAASAQTELAAATPDQIATAFAGLPPSEQEKVKSALAASEKDMANKKLEKARAGDVAGIVCDALRELGWNGIELSTVTVEQQDDKPVYKVSAAGASPPVVMLRFRSGPPVTLKERRTETAAKVFGDAGVSPGRLANGETWWIEPWVGMQIFQGYVEGTMDGKGDPWEGTLKDPKDASQCEKVLQAAADYGRLAARIHSIPTDWFEPFREEECKTYPFLRDMPEGNFLLLYQYWRAGPGVAGDDFDDVMQKHATDPEPLKQLLAAIPKPRCPAFSRVVTSHGDLWYANVLHSPNPGGGLLACDVESASVMSAIWDFMHAQIEYFEADTKLVHEHSGGEGTSFARVMVEAYLQQLGEPCGEDEVDAAVFDLRSFPYAFGIRDSMDKIFAGNDIINLGYLEEFGSRFRKHWEDPKLRSAVLSEPHDSDSPSCYLADLKKHMNTGSAPFIRGEA